MKKSEYNIVLIFIITLLIIGTIIIPAIRGKLTIKESKSIDGDILYVGGSGPGNYTNIQDAINNARDGDTIFVYSGEYPANIIIDKSIILIGENREKTIIQDAGDGIFVFADGVTITNLTITHCGGFWDRAGIYVASYDNTICYNNIINNDILNGIYLEHASNNNIHNNLIENCQYNGIKLAYSNHNSINGNMISNNRGIGIILHDSSNNNISLNSVARSFWGGINIYDNSNNNILCHNNLIENEVDNGYDICGNIWDNGVEGNFWDDYTGEDNDGDGIGDTPYKISGDTTQDNFPIMNIYEIPSTPIIDGPNNGKPDEEYEYKFLVIDPDKDDIFIYIDWGGNINTGWLGPYKSGMELNLGHTWSKKGSYLITARAKDKNGLLGFENSLKISIPKSNIINNSLFFRLIEQFPILVRLLFLIKLI
jgi:parallel beta-helix repeat protein